VVVAQLFHCRLDLLEQFTSFGFLRGTPDRLVRHPAENRLTVRALRVHSTSGLAPVTAPEIHCAVTCDSAQPRADRGASSELAQATPRFQVRFHHHVVARVGSDDSTGDSREHRAIALEELSEGLYIAALGLAQHILLFTPR